MTPILLKADAKTKIGWLSECTACEVTEERNGVYELELVYPIGATHANDIVPDCYIKAKPNQTSANQLFHIYKVSKPINGEFTRSTLVIFFRDILCRLFLHRVTRKSP